MNILIRGSIIGTFAGTSTAATTSPVVAAFQTIYSSFFAWFATALPQ
jgi:hypothetical protein